MSVLKKDLISHIQFGAPVAPETDNAVTMALEAYSDRIVQHINQSAAGHFEYDPSLTPTDPLAFHITNGMIRRGNTHQAVAARTITLTANTTHCIQVEFSDNTSTRVLHHAPTFVAGRIPLWRVTTNATGIATIEDFRTFYLSIEDGTKASKGIVMLSSNHNSTDETVAATPLAVKKVFDLVAAKLDASVVATTTERGIVELATVTETAQGTDNQRSVTPYTLRQAMTQTGMATPPSMIGYFARASAPTGWLKANGDAVSRTQYADLFAAIGTLYGAGDGSSTFNLPDLRGEFVRSLDEGRGLDSGRQLGSVQADQNRYHSHSGSTSSNGAHTHTYMQVDTASGAGIQAGSDYNDRGTYHATSWDGSHSHSVSISSSGGNESRPRNIALLACIKY